MAKEIKPSFKKKSESFSKEFEVEDNPTPTVVDPSLVSSVEKTVEANVDEVSGAEKIMVHDDGVVYEEVQLPSRGLFYGGKIPDGKIRVRMMYTEEEEIMTSARYIQSGQAVDMTLKNVTKNLPIETKDLLSGDRVYLLMWLRMTSYGNEYSTELTCPNSRKVFNHTFDLNKCDVKGPSDDSVEPFELDLPISKLKVWFRLPRGKDETYLTSIQDEIASGSKISVLAERMKRLIVKVQDIKTGEIEERPEYFKAKYLRRIPAGDSARFKNELEYRSPGINLSQKIMSPHSSTQFSMNIPFSQDFFSLKDHRS